MKHAMRLFLLAVFLALFVASGVLFRTCLFEYLIRPIAILLWAFWLILLSIDQKVLWGILIFLAVAYAVRRLIRIPSGPADQTTLPEANATLDRVNYWRTSILLCATDEIETRNILKRDLEQMLVTLYASRQPQALRLEIFKALQLREIPLPEHVYAFVFPPEPSSSKRSLKHMLQTIWQTPERWARRWAGQDVADYYRSIEDVLTLIESTLEIKHGDEQFDNDNH